jgi:crossover junction endodeoxyribonuclease RusA
VNLFEILIPAVPRSLQTNSRSRLQTWKKHVRATVAEAWDGQRMLTSGAFHLTLVYLYTGMPADVDNIIKPIQDALEGVVVSNDILVTDVESHRRFLYAGFDLEKLPKLLSTAVYSATACVYVRLRTAQPLEEVL